MHTVSKQLQPDQDVIENFLSDVVQTDIHLAAITPDGAISGNHFGSDNVATCWRIIDHQRITKVAAIEVTHREVVLAIVFTISYFQLVDDVAQRTTRHFKFDGLATKFIHEVFHADGIPNRAVREVNRDG